MKQLLSRLMHDEDGQDLIEYVLIAAAISVIAIPIVPQVGTAIVNAWSFVTGKPDGLTPAP